MIIGYRKALRTFDRNVWLWLGTWICQSICYSGIQMVVFNLYLLRLGYGTEFLGVINAMIPFSFSLFALAAGVLGTKLGGRVCMIIGFGIAALSMSFLPLADLIAESVRVVWLLSFVAINGVGTALFIVNSTPFAIAHTPLRVGGKAEPCRDT